MTVNIKQNGYMFTVVLKAITTRLADVAPYNNRDGPSLLFFTRLCPNPPTLTMFDNMPRRPHSLWMDIIIAPTAGIIGGH